MYNKKVILTTVGIVILLAAIVYVCSRISPLIGNYSVEKNEKKGRSKTNDGHKITRNKIENNKTTGNKKTKSKKVSGKY